MHDAFLGPEPAELILGDEAAPEPGEVAGDPLERAPDDERLERADRCDADLGAATVRERQAVARQLRVVGVQHDVRRRIVRAAVHRVRPVQGPGGGEAEVVDGEADYLQVKPLDWSD